MHSRPHARPLDALQRGIRLLRLLSALRSQAFSAQRRKRVRRAQHITRALGGALAGSRRRRSMMVVGGQDQGTGSAATASQSARSAGLAPRASGSAAGGRLAQLKAASDRARTSANPIASLRLDQPPSPGGPGHKQPTLTADAAGPDSEAGVRATTPSDHGQASSPNAPPSLSPPPATAGVQGASDSRRSQSSLSGRLTAELQGAAARMCVVQLGYVVVALCAGSLHGGDAGARCVINATDTGKGASCTNDASGRCLACSMC